MSNSSSTVWPFSVLSNDYGVADYYRYIHPIFAFIACFHSLLCTIVLAQKEVRSSRPFFKYSLVNSAGAVVTFFLLGFLFVSKCGGSVCSISTTYWLQAYATYAIYYVEYVYFIVSALIQIASGIQVYLAVRRQLRWLRKMSPYKVCIVFFGVCSLLGLVSLFTYAIDPFPVVTTDSNGTAKTDTYYYSHVVTNQPILTQIATAILIISNYVFLVILIVVDGLIYSEFRRIVVKRRIVIDHTSKTDPDSMRISTFGLASRVTDSLAPVNAIGPVASASAAAAAIHTSSDYQKARERSLLRRSLVMTFWISVLFSLDRFMKCIYFTSVLTNPTGKSTIYLNAVSYVFDMIIYSSFFFVYMQTSKMFNKKFYQIVFRRKN